LCETKKRRDAHILTKRAQRTQGVLINQISSGETKKRRDAPEKFTVKDLISVCPQIQESEL